MKQRHSDYMYWAKTRQRAKYTLATSGVGSFPLKELPFTPDQLEINGNTQYGWEPLKRAIAGKCGVAPDCVVTADGASGANFLAIATLIEPADDVLIESPAYELVVSAALFCGANVIRFERREEDGYALDAREVRRSMTPATKLIVLTNLHNPSSVQASEAALREIGDLARSAGARVLVDEVYRDAIYEKTPASAFHFGSEFVITDSLTKVYGVSGLRCGWILADPDLAWRMYRLNDLFSSIPVHAGNLLSVIAFEHLDKLRQRARMVVEADREAWNRFLDSQPRLYAPRTDWGTTAFVRLLDGDTERFVERLREEYDTSVVPGRFFGSPAHFRLGMGVDHAMFVEGLRRMSELLARF
jgi:aspartate/methionine/tyrosine aminotransferase